MSKFLGKLKLLGIRNMLSGLRWSRIKAFNVAKLMGVVLLVWSNLALFQKLAIPTSQTANPEVGEQKVAPFYKRKHNFDCRKLINGEEAELSRASNISRPIKTAADFLRSVKNCSHFFAENSYFYANKPLSNKEANFPLAYVILVDDDVEFVESLVNSIYAPQNHYCIHVDLKAARIIYEALLSYCNCFKNIYITESVSVVWASFPMVQAVLNCLKSLLAEEKQWNYVIILQGHDFPLKTNREIVEILSVFQGANDVELERAQEERFRWKHLWQSDDNGLFSGLNRTSVTNVPPPDGLKLYKGSIAASLFREFIQFLQTSQTSLRFQSWLKQVEFPDEFLWSTLVHNEWLQAPGWYPGSCLNSGSESGPRKKWITRLAHWEFNPNQSCQAGRYRNSVCLFGIRDLKFLTSPEREYLFVNKFWPKQDPISSDCMHEWLFNRTYYFDQPMKQTINKSNNRLSVISDRSINISIYANHSAVRFQQHLRSNAQRTSVDNQFSCA